MARSNLWYTKDFKVGQHACDLQVWVRWIPSFDLQGPAKIFASLHAVACAMCHVPPIDPWQAPSSFRRFGASNGATPVPIRPAVRALLPKILEHTYTRTDWQTRPVNYFSPTHQWKSSFIERSMLLHLNVHSLRFWTKNTPPNPTVYRKNSFLPYFTLPNTTLHTTLHDTTLHYNILHYTLHFIASHYSAPHYTTLLCNVALHFNTKQYPTLPYIIHPFPTVPYLPYTLHYTTLQYILYYTFICHSWSSTLLFATFGNFSIPISWA